LAGSLFLIIYAVAGQPTDKGVGPCERERRDAGQAMPGKFIPQCTEYGFYQPTQCHGSSGKCWCVVPDSGREIEGTSTFRTGPPQCTMCNIKRSEALRASPFVGHYVPACDKDGLYETEQVHGSTGQSWCVNPYTGVEIPNTRVGPGQQRSKQCSEYSLLVGFAMHSALEEQGPCYAKMVEARGRESTPGFYTPACTPNGYYKTEQSHSSTGYTWCVNPATGEEVKGSHRGPGQQRSECGTCFKETESKITRKPLIGNDLPQCNQENGDYIPEQHHEGYSWCVNPKTGAVEGQKHAPGDNTSLPCVNH